MKFLNIKNSRFLVLLLALSTITYSCDEFLDVDTDKDNPTEAPLNLLLTGIQVDFSAIADFDAYSGSVLQVYTHQMTVREEPDQYGTRPDNAGVNNDWNNIYLMLTNINSLIEQSFATENTVYTGIGQIHKAYVMHVAVDLWGDVPFSEANQLKAGIKGPKFDDQKEIYKEIFTLIDEGIANIEANGGNLKPATDDLFYGGDRAKWIKFANTLKLKLFNQIRLSTEFDQAAFDQLVAENNFFTSSSDDFEFKHYNTIAPSDHRNRFFIESYMSTQFGSYMSPWFYEILKGMNPNIHTANADPRIPYYFFNQLIPDQLPPDQGIPSTGNPRADYWDKSTGFFAIRFGSTGPNRDFSTEKSVTYPGIFPTGGRYDDGQGGDVNAMMSGTNPQQPTGIAPRRMLTYDEFLFIKAELQWAGKMAGDAGATLRQAIVANFAKVDQVVALNESPQSNIPVLSTLPTATPFIDAIIAEYNAGSNDKKLEVIMTQKWVATFGDPFDQYNDYRRTGYPVLANPLSTTREYQLDNGDAWPIDDSQTTQGKLYPLSLYWPLSELNSNLNAPAQKDPTAYKIFWDN